MTEDIEMSKDELKKQAKKEYMKLYMKKRRETDPVFADKQREATRRNLQNRYANDAVYKQQKQQYDKNRYKQYKEAFELLKQMKQMPENVSL